MTTLHSVVNVNETITILILARGKCLATSGAGLVTSFVVVKTDLHFETAMFTEIVRWVHLLPSGIHPSVMLVEATIDLSGQGLTEPSHPRTQAGWSGGHHLISNGDRTHADRENSTREILVVALVAVAFLLLLNIGKIIGAWAVMEVMEVTALSNPIRPLGLPNRKGRRCLLL